MRKTIRKVGLIRGYSQYDVMRSWTLELEKGFNKLGIEVIVYDFKYHENLNLNFDKEIDFFISVNGWTLPALTEMVDKPIIMYLADHVSSHIERIQSLRKQDILTVVDRFDFKILEILGIHKYAYFLPHAALETNYLEVQKEYDFLFLGGYSDKDEHLNSINKLKVALPIFYNKIFQILEMCLVNRDFHSLYDGIKLFENEGIILDEENRELITISLKSVGWYIYAKEREEIIKQIALKGYNIQVFGNGWEKSSLHQFENIKFNNPVNYYESQNLIAKSKILINASPFLRDGSHERIFAGIANNTYVLSNYSSYLEELNNKKVLFYNLNELDKVWNKIDSILNLNNQFFYDKDLLDDIYNNHTFVKRAENILEIFNYHQENVMKYL